MTRGRPQKEERNSVFSERLGILLRARGMTQRELADKAGISSGLICEYLHKNREPQAKTIIKLAKTMGYRQTTFWG